ncbi:MAG: PP2C family protein-serine/threonine phosphatase [Pseudomonadales bacterium]
MTSQQILIISGADDAYDILSDLAKEGFTAANISDPANAIESIRAAVPSLILLSIADTENSKISTMLLLSKIRGQFPQMKVVVVASDLDDPTVPEHLAAGADDYLYYSGVQKELLPSVVARHLASPRLPEVETEGDLETTLRTLEQDQQSGFRVQQAMMPNSPMSIRGLTFNHQLYPSMIMSGDFIDYFELFDGRAVFYIADVSGHGASSAFITVLLKSLSRRMLDNFNNFADTAQVLCWINTELLQWQLEHHVTMFIGVIDQELGLLEYSNAAHFPGTILCHEEGASFLEVGGQPLGLYPAPQYQSHQLALPTSYAIVMFSDGVFEIMPQKSLEAKEKQLLSVVQDHCQDELDTLVDDLGVLTAAHIPDDIAVFTVASSQ